MENQFKLDAPWYITSRFRRQAQIIMGVILIVSFWNGVIKKHNDFRNHFKLGKAFIQGDPYVGGTFCTHYPLGRLLQDVAFAALPYRLSRAVWWILGMLILYVSLAFWQRMAAGEYPLPPPLSFAATIFSLVVVLRWLVRDMDDCGQQLLLLGILTGAAWAAYQGRAILTGALLGTGATYKLTPLLFLPLLLYKRRWKEALWMVVFVLAWNLLLPAMRLGFHGSWQANKLFLAKSIDIMHISRDNPTANGVEPPRHTNRNLRLSIARYLQTYPPGHPLFIADHKDQQANSSMSTHIRAHPLFIQFLDLPPKVAAHIITLILLVMALMLAFRFPHPWNGTNQADFSTEWAMAMALCALLSPLCWGQHLVLFIPLVLLCVRTDLGRSKPRWRKILLWIAAILILLPQRELIGRTLWLIIQSYKVETWACVLLLILAGTRPRYRERPPALANVPDTWLDSTVDSPPKPRD